MMGKGVLVVWSNPESPDKDADYNRWYNDIHIPEMTDSGHCKRVTRYKVSDDTQMPGAAGSSYRYFAIYEFDDVEAGVNGMRNRAKPSTPGPIDPNTRRMVFEGVFDFTRA
jgi:hypothetical protein